MRILGFNRLRNAMISKRTGGYPASCTYKRLGSQLIIDCVGCHEKQSLANRHCRGAILRILSREAGVESIVLSALWETSYTGECVAALKEIAEIVAMCQDLGSEARSSSECQNCPLNPARFYSEVANNLPILPEKQGLREVASKMPNHSAACDNCLIGIGLQLEEMRKRIDEIGLRVARRAFKVVGHETEYLD